MKIILTFLLLTITSFAFNQNELVDKYKLAGNLFNLNNKLGAYKLLKEIETKCDKKDTLYRYILWSYVITTTELEKYYRTNEKFDLSLQYGIEALQLIEDGTKIFTKDFTEKAYWMRKNLIISYFGLGQFNNAKKHRDFLYKAYKKKELPEGIDAFFNFDYFKLNGLNVWGYEFYPELPNNRFSSSFTKIVYYVYSTNPDGTDNEELYRFHVLMFHQESKETSFDYLLEKQCETENSTVSGS